MLALRRSGHSRVVAFIVVLAMVLLYTFSFAGVVFAAEGTLVKVHLQNIDDTTASHIVSVDAVIGTDVANLVEDSGKNKYTGRFNQIYNDTSGQLATAVIIYFDNGTSQTVNLLQSADGNGDNSVLNIKVSTEIIMPPTGHDIAVNKVVDDSTATLDQTVVFTITAANRGPEAAEGVVIDDLLPAGLEYDDHSASVGSYVASTGAWTIGSMAVDASATLTISAIFAEDVEVGDSFSNTAAYDYEDNDTTNNSGTARVRVVAAPLEGFDIEVEKTVDDATAYRNQSVTFTVIVSNNGPDTAYEIQISDIIPQGLDVDLIQYTTGSYIEGVWNIGTMGSGSSETLTIEATVTAAVGTVITNTATWDGQDNDNSNNEDDASVTVIRRPGGGGGTTTTIDEPEVPLTPIPTEPEPEVIIPEPEVPLADVPQTGATDDAALYAGMLLGSLAGITALVRRKKTVSE